MNDDESRGVLGKTGRLRPFVVHVVLVGISLVFFLAMGEAALRLSGYLDVDIETARYAALVKVPSSEPAIGYVQRPNVRVRLMNVEVRTNADGLRDQQASLAGGGGPRYAFLGDSITFGWGVEESESFAALLEASLSPVEIVNFGTVGYNTAQQVALLRHQTARSTVQDTQVLDTVVVFYFLNDAEPPLPIRRTAFLGRSHFLSFLTAKTAKALRRLGGRRQTFREHYADLYRDDASGWDVTRRSFQDLQRFCTENGTDLRVVLLPDLHELADYPFHKEHRLVTTFLTGVGIPVLDLAPAFADVENPRELWVAPDDAHPNAIGHRRIAEAVLPFLKEVNR